MLPHFKPTKEHKFWQPGETELIAKQAGKNVDTDDIRQTWPYCINGMLKVKVPTKHLRLWQ